MIVDRKYCILSKKKLKNFIKIKNFPIFSGSTSQDFKNLFCDLNYGISNSSGILQLQKLVKPKILYSKYHSEALGDLWRQHNQAFSKFLIKYCDERIIEMGGGNNQIARICSINRKIKKWFNF